MTLDASSATTTTVAARASESYLGVSASDPSRNVSSAGWRGCPRIPDLEAEEPTGLPSDAAIPDRVVRPELVPGLQCFLCALVLLVVVGCRCASRDDEGHKVPEPKASAGVSARANVG